jgi:cell division protein ZapE
LPLISERLAHLVAAGTLAADPLQADAARVLDRVAAELAARPGLFRPSKPVRGAYLVGQVGRGKTMLMDLFFAQAPVALKRRVHFHEFMNEMHEAIAAFRKSARAADADPVAAVTRGLLKEVRLLCLDEFQVQDITNAMLLGRLFDQLFDGGVTIVATSNTLPDDLYRDGLNRQLILPFIAALKERVDIVPLDGATDYRRLKFAGEAVYRFGVGPETDAAMDRLWLKLTGGDRGAPDSVESLGRSIPVPHAAMGAARFDFAGLCDAPLGARDYLKIAHRYETLMLERVPHFTPLNANAAKRFILLIDTLYDRGVKLSASFAAPLDALVEDAKMAGEFQRCVSRLVEMQSAAYLEAAPKPEPVQVV